MSQRSIAPRLSSWLRRPPPPLAQADGSFQSRRRSDGGDDASLQEISADSVELSAASVEPIRHIIPSARSVATPNSTRCCDKQRHALGRAIDSVYCQGLLLLLIAIDLTLTVYQIIYDLTNASNVDADLNNMWLVYATITIVTILLVEVLLRRPHLPGRVDARPVARLRPLGVRLAEPVLQF